MSRRTMMRSGRLSSPSLWTADFERASCWDCSGRPGGIDTPSGATAHRCGRRRGRKIESPDRWDKGKESEVVGPLRYDPHTAARAQEASERGQDGEQAALWGSRTDLCAAVGAAD